LENSLSKLKVQWPLKYAKIYAYSSPDQSLEGVSLLPFPRGLFLGNAFSVKDVIVMLRIFLGRNSVAENISKRHYSDRGYF